MTVAFVRLNGTRVTTTAGRVQCRDIPVRGGKASRSGGKAVGFDGYVLCDLDSHD